ncbi:MAG: CDP-alcohol phosphatidyltransferase family protein [Candidatus Saccharimonadales bacterium]
MATPTQKEPFSSLKWIPNLITLSRSVLALIALSAALQHRWEAALWLILAAIATDFLDGLAAKKLNATSAFGEQFDALTDSFVVITGMLSLGLTRHLSWWIIAIILIGGFAVGSDRFFKQPLWKWRTILAVACLFIAWIMIVWFYASLAFGWSWLYVVLTLIVLVGCAALKRHRIRAWIG